MGNDKSACPAPMGTRNMQSKPLPRNPADLRAERETELKDFIEGSLLGADPVEAASVLLVARSPESVAFQSLFSLSGALTCRGISARVVILSGEPGERWNVEFEPGFQHEIRLGHDIRLLDAHEQIVAGDAAVWFGDSMRREPERRDAFSQFNRDNSEMARRARMTFDHLWSVCRPLYRHEFALAGSLSAAADTLAAWHPLSRQ